MSFMGYPGSMGSSVWTDMLISDAVASPPEWQAHYTEKLMYLPQSYYINDFPFRLPDVGSYRDPPHAGALANLSRASFGLQDAAFVFVCFSRAEKIDRKLFDAWMAILRQVPQFTSFTGTKVQILTRGWPYCGRRLTAYSGFSRTLRPRRLRKRRSPLTSAPPQQQPA